MLQDLRTAVRSLTQTPSLTVAVVLSLAIGIGANTTVFTWVQAVLLDPVPGARDPNSLFVVNLESRDGRERSWSYPNFRDLRARAQLVDIVGQDDLAMSIAVAGQAERAYGGIVSGNYFQMMGVRPALGRLLGPEDDRAPGGHPVAVISHAYWQRRFAGDPTIVGREVTINSTPMTIIGVAEPTFIGSFLGVATAAWVPMAMQPQMMGGSRLEARGSGWMQLWVRLHAGASRAQAQAELSAMMAQLEQAHREANEGLRVRVVRVWEAPFGAPSVLAPILSVLSIVVALVLLIACANVANLLLSRAVGRRREIAVRLSLGASRARLLRQLLTEAMLLSTVSGILGLLFAYWTFGLLMAFAPPTDLPLDFGLTIDRQTFAFAAIVSLATGVFFGLAPAWQASRPDTVHALKEESSRSGSGGRATRRLRNGLVVAQVAVCLVLLVGAGLFTRSLAAAQQITPGFDAHNLLIATVDLFPNGYTADTGRQFQRRLTEAITALPGVESFALGRQMPLGLTGFSSMGVSVRGYTPQPNEEINISYNVVGPRYFETMKIGLVAGRPVTADDTTDAPKVAVVNETMARRYWPGREAIGGHVRLAGDDYQVVGVVRDIKYTRIAEPPQPYMYLALEQRYVSNVVLHVRSATPPGPMLAAMRQAVLALDPNLPIFDARTAEEHMQAAVFAQRMGANLLGAMGVLALVLAAIGLYGVVSYAVSQRTQEMGIRLALGALPGDLRRMILRQGLTLTLAGLTIGLALSLGAVGFMRALLPGITPHDPLTFVGVPVVLIAISTLAALLPARRAAATDPVVALRYE